MRYSISSIHFSLLHVNFLICPLLPKSSPPSAMELDSSKEEALLFWFNTYGTSIDLAAVDSLKQLWLAHIPSLQNCLQTNQNKKVLSTNAYTTYQNLYTHLLNANDQNVFVESLSVEKAAEGNCLEIAKFLAVLLNELRISNPDVIKESVAVMEREGQDEPLREILGSFDEEQTNWWSVMLSRSDFELASGAYNSQFVTPRRPSLPVEEFSGMSVNRSAFATPCGPRLSEGRRRNNGAYTVARCEGSPLMEAINSPKVRELRRDREIRSLKKQLNDLEDQLSLADSRALNYKRENDSLIVELTSKKARIRELERSEKLLLKDRDDLEDKLGAIKNQMEQLQSLCASQKQRIAMHKSSAEEWEEKKTQLTEKLKAKESALVSLERKLRDINDEHAGALQTVRVLETERDNLSALLAETKHAAESERDQYQASISEWRKRCEAETSEQMFLYSSEMAKNAALQQELREQCEKLEKLQKQYEDSKRIWEESKQAYIQKYEAVSKRLAEVEAELTDREERHERFANEHEAIVRQLEGAHLAENAQRDSKIRCSRARIDELESSLAECNRVILQQRKEMATLIEERDAVDAERSLMRTHLDEKDAELSEASTTIEKLKSQISDMELKHSNTLQSMGSLQSDCARLQAGVDAKDLEIFEMQSRYDLLLSDERNNLTQELLQTRKELEEERERNREQESLMKATAEDLKHKLEDLTTRSNNQASLISQIEAVVVNELHSVQEKEQGEYKTECEALREKDLIRTQQIQDLCKKFDRLENDLDSYNKKNCELELQIVQLKEENAQYRKCIELSNFKPDKELIKMRFPNASASKGTLRRTVERVPSPAANSIFLVNEEEPPVCEMSTTDLKYMDMEGAPIPTTLARKPPRPKSPSKADLAKHRTVPPSGDKRPDFQLDTDRSRLAELQKRNAMLHPAMRCAYGVEMGAYNSPTGNENTVKHGSARRKSGMFFQRASSYVRRKLPLSDSTNSHQ
ncbi:hypothetical protein GCK32_002087 [Trichostrongylus colubriformis]|uniref:HOOK N-terminal domain-containing protein n=1 Tax=Trichostrongylus colubriformis TaxID=6319 RepID=A0AAN8IT68_TRICO